jgi:putative tricarboxylic transport membrane protein
MLIMGALGYGLRKLSLDPAPLVLGLVISPTFELSLRQSLIMSNSSWTILIALVLFATAALLLSLSLLTLIRRRADWRARLATAEAGEDGQ